VLLKNEISPPVKRRAPEQIRCAEKIDAENGAQGNSMRVAISVALALKGALQPDLASS
jgi:hypothetical protein